MFIGIYNVSVILTYVGVAFAVSGTALAFCGKIKLAVICLIISGVCDLFDGSVARRCKRTDKEKKFGVQIDSLCDVVNFLALPVAICLGCGFTRHWQTAIYVLYVLAGISRLGYFNVKADSEATVKYYCGLPVTYSALIFPILWLAVTLLCGRFIGIVLPIGLLIIAVLFILNIKIPKPGKISSIIFAFIAFAAVIVLCLIG